MNKLPPEVVCDIFLRTTESDYHRFLPSRGCVLHPLRISHVCRRWRELAVSYGPLWSYFRTDNDFYPRMEIFDLFQQRSNGAPLYFHIRVLYAVSVQKCSYANYVINALVAQQNRWCEAKLLWIGRGDDELLVLNLTNMPMLTVFELDCSRDMTATIDLRRSQNLREFNISCDFELLERKIENPPPLRLISTCCLTFTNFSLGKASVRSCIDFLEMAPLLRRLDVRFYVFDSSQYRVARGGRILLSNLREMEYTGFAESELVLDSLTLPSLEVLDLHTTRQGETLVNLFKRSVPPLRVLSIHCAGTSEETIIEVLRLIPTLQEFHSHLAFISSRFFRELTVGSVGNNAVPALCPALAYLRITSYGGRPAEDSAVFLEAFLLMVESRARHLNTFSKVTIDDNHENLDISTLRNLSFRDLEEYPSLFVWRDGYSRELER